MVDWDGQADTFYFIQVDAFGPTPQFSQAQLRAEQLDEMRRWTWAELQQAQRRQDSGQRAHPEFVTLSPQSLFHLLEDLIAQGRPREPLRLEAV